MKEHLNNKGRITFRIVFIIFFSMLYAICNLLYPELARSGSYLGTPPNFDDSSAHGNPNYGVKRNAVGFPSDYTRGLCAHCHEQHASINGAEPEPNTGNAAGPDKYLLFRQLFEDQDTMFCFGCHKKNSLQVSMPLQYNYSHMAGGNTGFTYTDPDSIQDAFNPPLGGSRHYLDYIRTFLLGRWGFGSTKSNIDPCSGCHNPHRAKRDHHGTDITPQRTDSNGKLIVSSVSRPSQHTDLTTWQLWGDENGERMSDKATSSFATYCAPYQYNATNRREPDGCVNDPNECSKSNGCTNGSKLFDSVTFCLDCHLYPTAYTIAIDWISSNGDQHGAAASQVCCDWGDRNPPYSEGVNYILSCLDCHEPHGSPNEYLLRSEVNGIHTGPVFDGITWHCNDPIGLTFGTHKYYCLCIACHTNLITGPEKHSGASITPDSDCWTCHRHGASQARCGCAAAKTF